MTAIDGIVLAAGRSSRMGTSKAQLATAAGSTFLEHAIHLLRDSGCRYVVAVLAKDDDWSARLADAAGAAVVLNDRPDSEQIDSIRLGIGYLPEDSAGVLVLPVDLPSIDPATVQQLIATFLDTQAPIVLPEVEGKTGHPALFAAAVYGELMAELPNGAESLIAAHPELVQVAVADRGILFDIDEPGDYDRYRQAR